MKENYYLVESVIKDGTKQLVLAGEMNTKTIQFLIKKQLDIILPYNDIKPSELYKLVLEGMTEGMAN